MNTENSNRNKKYLTFIVKAISLLMLVSILSLTLVLFTACNKRARLLFSDEFNADKVDETKWDIHGAPRNEGDPGELRHGGWWTKDSVSQQDGNLVIRTTYDTEKNTFYTGCIDSKELMVYGYYEARCKVPEAFGMWAAFWIMCGKMGEEIPDAHVGGAEIDIFESPYYGYGKGSVQHAVHTAGYGDKKQDHSTLPPISLDRSEDVSNGYEEWHTYALDWQPDYYRFYVDGKLTWETKAPYRQPGDENYIETNVSSVPSYIMFSVEVGGENSVPGSDPFFLSAKNPVDDNLRKYGSMENFSVDFLVDYVRVYDRKPGA